MTHPHTIPTNNIPLARPEEIDNNTLLTIRDKVYDFRRGADVSQAEAVFIFSALGPLLDELIERRTVQTLMVKHLKENVVYLEDHREGA